MEVEEAIKKRRSIRKYLDRRVEWEKVGKVIEAASYSPSAGNIQNWQFIVVTDEKSKQEIAEASLKQYWIATAPLLIVICDKKEEIRRFYGERGERLYSIQNCALAAQNIMLTATALGLSTCWVGAFNEEAVSKVLKIPPKDITPEIIITLGYTTEEIINKPQRHPLDRMTFFNEWGNSQSELGIFPLEKHKEEIDKKAHKITELLKKIIKKEKANNQ